MPISQTSSPKVREPSQILSIVIYISFKLQPHTSPTYEGIDEESYRIVFDLFDRDKSGYIDNTDLQEIAISLNRDPLEVIELVQSFDPNNDGKIAFAEFVAVMQALESRVSDEFSLDMGSNIEDQKKKFGNMLSLLPKNGGGFMPDSKVLDFLRLLNDYQKKQLERQQRNMQIAQKLELEQIEANQQQQFLEFSNAWDKYMQDYEAAAYKSLEKLKEKHDEEILQAREQLKIQYPVIYTLSKELMDLRNLEKKNFALKEYQKAENYKRQADKMERDERQVQEQQQAEKIEREIVKLKGKQQAALNSLLKRIQRDRDEQLKHRTLDSQRLIQRNRNILQDIIMRQQLEAKKTLDFLKYSLGKRSPQKPNYNQSTQLSVMQIDSTSNYKLPLIKSVMNSSMPPIKIGDVGNISPFMTSNDYQADDITKNRTFQKSTKGQSVGRGGDVTPVNLNNSFNLNKSQNYGHNRSFQVTDNVAQNFKKVKNLQSNMQRYGAVQESLKASQTQINNKSMRQQQLPSINRTYINQQSEEYPLPIDDQQLIINVKTASLLQNQQQFKNSPYYDNSVASPSKNSYSNTNSKTKMKQIDVTQDRSNRFEVVQE
ncbi:ca2+-binding protein (ef-hand superfamily) [Stylonychia lemnae]|uniref:Ca2+-binding protein (Ef-hand superfamily) n=1 Tax=Stylonychia lemnae TaxID=5949 RepID=A0A078A6U4_STYLE|nr:ca2+-binding protein (ef-hand superfamily) [Stylonychia lemnae]|eukprot:CDW77949.1 ca2+-binding protein (ef-hand superfamily) [Stylonychia lemnae]